MKRTLSFFSLLILLVATACHNTPKTNPVAVAKTDTASYYQVGNYFKSEIQQVDLGGYRIKQLHTVNGKKDSAVISNEQFLAMAALFTRQADLFSKTKQLYKENVFKDLSTQSVTLTYSPVTASSNGLQTLDVLLADDTNQPKHVFIKTTHVSGDTATTEQYSWRTQKGFQFTRFITAHNFSSVELAEVSWQRGK